MVLLWLGKEIEVFCLTFSLFVLQHPGFYIANSCNGRDNGFQGFAKQVGVNEIQRARVDWRLRHDSADRFIRDHGNVLEFILACTTNTALAIMGQGQLAVNHGYFVIKMVEVIS